MLFKGYDKAVAEANGYTIETSAQGFEYSVKKNATDSEDAAAQQLAAARWGGFVHELRQRMYATLNSTMNRSCSMFTRSDNTA
ncbi:hypothetical protein [Kitasatospora sp. NPDC001683]